MSERREAQREGAGAEPRNELSHLEWHRDCVKCQGGARVTFSERVGVRLRLRPRARVRYGLSQSDCYRGVRVKLEGERGRLSVGSRVRDILREWCQSEVRVNLRVRERNLRVCERK